MRCNSLCENPSPISQTLHRQVPLEKERGRGKGTLRSSTNVQSWVVFGRLLIMMVRDGMIPQGPLQGTYFCVTEMSLVDQSEPSLRAAEVVGEGVFARYPRGEYCFPRTSTGSDGTMSMSGIKLVPSPLIPASPNKNLGSQPAVN
jgi:hypothetical protein